MTKDYRSLKLGRKIRLNLKTTTKNGKKEYQKRYMLLYRKKQLSKAKKPRSVAEAILG